ncbi:MAG: hypothetical protein H7315_10000, partial [Herminiimonas sp.]|nr:hypothetical protein [Herminiimonas sp.]
MKADSDVLILGGGCAGLSLARELAGFGARCPSARIIEQRARYENDRTWCFWGDNGALMSHLSDHQWSRALLRARGQVITFDCIKHPYHMISGARFYGDALQKIADVPQIQLEKGVTILSEPRLINGLWQIETDVGVRRGQKLIDTRGHVKSRQQHEAPILWQSFLGHEITCEEPIFDPATVTLMDFADDSSGRIVFTYLLPLSAKRALIEVTVFGKSPVTPAELASPLQQ